MSGAGRQSVEGADAAFAEFMAAQHRGLLRSAFLLVGDRGLAEDLVQDALFRAYLSWPRLRATEAALSYTRTTLVRVASRSARRRWRGELPTANPTSEAHPDGAFDRDVAIDVRAALARLSWGQRAVLVLRYFDDLSEAQTAAVLGCSVGTVKSRASRGLEALRSAGLIGSATDSEVHDG